MSFESIPIPPVDFDPRLDEVNIFASVFGDHTAEQWRQVLVSSLTTRRINEVDFPTFPPAETQNRIHGHNGEASLNEADAFYRFACENNLAGPNSPWFMTGTMLDFGSGWGRIVRPFMRDFPLRNIIGYEPSNIFSVIARANNPFVSFVTGGHLPDGLLPSNWFNLITAWSVYSHLSQDTISAWLAETARILKPSGAALYTTWGLRFLRRLKDEAAQMEAGQDIHWYSKVCLLGAGDIDKRIEDYQSGEFVWFDSLQNSLYGEAFVSRPALQAMIDAQSLPLTVEVFDDTTLQQDAFILRKQ